MQLIAWRTLLLHQLCMVAGERREAALLTTKALVDE